MKKLLVTGISGFLGWHVAHHQQSDWEIKGVYNYNKPERVDNERCLKFFLN